MKPLLIVVTGRPGSGKTTLAHLVAKEVCCPVVSRDEIKEGYCVTQQADHTALPEDTNKRIFDIYFGLLREFLSQGISVVAEAAFQHKLWAPQLEALAQVASVRLIRCAIDPELARRRAVERGLVNPRRERFHRDFAVEAARQGLELPIGGYTPPSLDVPTLDVETDGDYSPSLAEIVEFALHEAGSQSAR